MADSLLRRALFAIPPEPAHRLTVRALAQWGAIGCPLAPELAATTPVTIAGLTFANPLGLAAGVDKDAEAIDGFLALGFGSVEVGTLTPRPQPGNPRPRLFRLVEDGGIVNRMGFNNGGIDAALARVARAKRSGVVGINVGANKDSVDRIADYAWGVARVAPLADYITINISSPNTPGLRDLQEQPMLGELLAACDRVRFAPDGTRRPLFLKVAPDLDRGALQVAIEAAVDAHIDALIVSNTTIARPATLKSRNARQAGGLSGAPLVDLARAKLAEAVEIANGALSLVSVGGIASPEEARRRLEMGASLVQLYSGLVYEGPGLAARIVRGLADRKNVMATP